MLKLIIFDMDGLMFATEQVNYRAFTEIVKEEGYNPTFEQYIGFLGMNAKDIQKKYYVYYGEDVDAEGIYKKVGNRSKQIIREEGVPVKRRPERAFAGCPGKRLADSRSERLRYRCY